MRRPQERTFIPSSGVPTRRRRDTNHDLDMRALTITTLEPLKRRCTPVIWVAAVHDDHTDKNHVHALAAVNRRLDKPELRRLIEVATTACLEQRRELDWTQGVT